MTIIYIFYEQIVFQYRFFDLFIDLIIRSNASFVKWLRTCFMWLYGWIQRLAWPF